MGTHVPMVIAIPPKHAVSHVVGDIKDKRAIHLARVYGKQKRHCVGQHFRARGHLVGTVGRDEAVMRDDIRNQENEDTRLERMGLCADPPAAAFSRCFNRRREAIRRAASSGQKTKAQHSAGG